MEQHWYTSACRVPSDEHADAARRRQAVLTKPAGSLGLLEDVAVQLAGLQGRERPNTGREAALVFAADHGVAARGVSAYPAEVTVQMVGNFAAGGAAICVLARSLGLPLTVVDVGTLAPDDLPGTTSDKSRRGTRDLTTAAAMDESDLHHALGAGRRAVERTGNDTDLLLLGEMGIGNTTSAAAVACALLGEQPLHLVGAGTGLSADRVAHKAAAVEAALRLHGPGIADAQVPALEALRRLGGLELAALTGAVVAAAQRGLPVLVDGFIVSVAALAAVRLNPGCRPWLLFAHASAERGHARVLDALDARPLLQLGLRLGEASGAALAVPLVRLACALHDGMATFEEAAVSDRAADDAPPSR